MYLKTIFPNLRVKLGQINGLLRILP